MKSLNTRSFLFAAAVSAFLSSVGSGATYYVDQAASNANDANAGTEAAPWKTIQKGVTVAVAGDTVLVKQGIYKQALLLQRSGSSGAPITFKAYPGHTTVIDGSGLTTSKFIDWRGAPSGGTDKNYIAFDGFEVRNCAKWGFWVEGSHNTIKNCKVHDIGLGSSSVACILLRQGTYNLISSNDVYNGGWNGINCENNNYTVIQYNRSHHNASHFGVNVFPNTAEAQVMQSGNNIIGNLLYNNFGGIYSRYQQDNIIANNVIYDNTENGIFLHYNTTGSSTYVSRTKIYNNTIVGNRTHGIWNANATYLTIRNNILVNQATADRFYEIYMSSGKTAGHSIDYNLYWPNVAQLWNWGGTRYSLTQIRSVLGFEVHGKAVDPLFTNLAGKDYTLKSTSPALDGGMSLTEVPIDQKGARRPQGAAYDMGAYEFAGAGTTAAPPMPPTGLHTVP